MTPAYKWIGPLVCLTLLFPPALAEARQTVSSFEDLRLVVRQQDSLTVIDTEGREVTGKVSVLSPSSLTLLVDGRPREFSEGTISTITQRRGDSLANGALIGVAVGAGIAAVGVALTSATCEGGCSWEPAWAPIAAIGFYGAAGAGVGVGIDALIRRRQVIYATGKQTLMRIAPVVNKDRKGVALSINF